ncbi:UDP-4-amino-4,6-dideoxy-N-acetyl-beta-L-altrosami ne transaminase [Pilimelia columellifera subsp. columellifera]|uniref:UDP-4-amino-4, 6-dideoxy-N-acetyl-beta-L-altrosami ne transaminase n=1 Tax=Pilimelia columellifera subsp. columellifera TaxID=706583 RepID=A0ABN3MVG8_9ACTN
MVEAMRGDRLTSGPQVVAFEKELAEHVGGTPCVAVSSGTAALHTAYAAAGLSAGDEVITSPITFAATATTAVLRGATVVFADVRDDGAPTIDPDAVRSAVTPKTRVISVVDYAGHPAEYEPLRAVAADAGAALVADAAHSFGATYRGAQVGTLADLTAFSFFPNGPITTGEGGALAVADPALRRRARYFRDLGQVGEGGDQRQPNEGGWHQEVQELGLNYRLSDILCGLGRSQLRRVAFFTARRAAIARRYAELLVDIPGLGLPTVRDDVTHAWHLYPVRVSDGRRREVYDRMTAAGIGVAVHYLPVYRHPVFAERGYRRGMCPRAEAFYADQLSLPIFPDLTDAEQDKVVAELRQILG